MKINLLPDNLWYCSGPVQGRYVDSRIINLNWRFRKTEFSQSQIVVCPLIPADYDPDRFMYFGDTRGKKAFEDKNILILIGRHYLPHQALAMKGRAACTRIIEMNDADHDDEIGCRDFTDERMRLLGRYYNEGEVLQAIHRLRLLHGTENKTVIYLSNHVLDGLQVDKFLIADDVLLNENRMKLVKAVREHGAIDGNPRVIAEASGLTSKQVSNLKNKEWYKENPFFHIGDGGRLIDRYVSGEH